MTQRVLRFPEGFYWGPATSSYQVEGGIINNDWASFAKASGAQGLGERIPFAGKACDHYHRFEEDFDIARKLSQNAHRFSIEWARVEPEEGRWNFEAVEHYREVLNALRKRHMEPFMTLWHFTLPLWLSQKGGWENKKSVEYFARYAEFLARQYGDLVKFWITLNEPLVYVGEAYLKKRWPPQRKSPRRANRVRKNLLRAHNEAYARLKEISKSFRVGVAKHFVHYVPARNDSFLDKQLVRVMENFEHGFLKKIGKKQDFIGFNYYRPVHLRFNVLKPGNFFMQELAPGGDTTDMGWGIEPEGIYRILKKLKRYKKPIYITENGIADKKDEKRESFIKDHLAYVHKAIREGVNVKGYFYWSLLDNFEWTDGYGPKFGLVEVNFKTQKRTVRKSAYKYAKICRENGLLVD